MIWPNEMNTDRSGTTKRSWLKFIDLMTTDEHTERWKWRGGGRDDIEHHKQRDVHVALRHIHRYHSKISNHVIISVSSVLKTIVVDSGPDWEIEFSVFYCESNWPLCVAYVNHHQMDSWYLSLICFISFTIRFSATACTCVQVDSASTHTIFKHLVVCSIVDKKEWKRKPAVRPIEPMNAIMWKFACCWTIISIFWFCIVECIDNKWQPSNSLNKTSALELVTTTQLKSRNFPEPRHLSIILWPVSSTVLVKRIHTNCNCMMRSGFFSRLLCILSLSLGCRLCRCHEPRTHQQINKTNSLPLNNRTHPKCPLSMTVLYGYWMLVAVRTRFPLGIFYFSRYFYLFFSFFFYFRSMHFSLVSDVSLLSLCCFLLVSIDVNWVCQSFARLFLQHYSFIHVHLICDVKSAHKSGRLPVVFLVWHKMPTKMYEMMHCHVMPCHATVWCSGISMTHTLNSITPDIFDDLIFISRLSFHWLCSLSNAFSFVMQYIENVVHIMAKMAGI